MSAVDPAASTLPPPTEPRGPIVLLQCACGSVYTPGEWPSLENPRSWRIEGRLYELRDCKCGSTISREVPR